MSLLKLKKSIEESFPTVSSTYLLPVNGFAVAELELLEDDELSLLEEELLSVDDEELLDELEESLLELLLSEDEEELSVEDELLTAAVVSFEVESSLSSPLEQDTKLSNIADAAKSKKNFFIRNPPKKVVPPFAKPNKATRHSNTAKKKNNQEQIFLLNKQP